MKKNASFFVFCNFVNNLYSTKKFKNRKVVEELFYGLDKLNLFTFDCWWKSLNSNSRNCKYIVETTFLIPI